MSARWKSVRVNDWYSQMPWLVGCNYIPRNAINQLEMWQGETFSPDVIREELGWAKTLGFNSIRLFLHDLLWRQDAKRFLKRIDTVLGIAARHGIGVMPVLFDSVWHPFPHAGQQPDPEPGVHNSGWVQSPGVAVLQDDARFNALKDYVVGVIQHFKDDERVQIWDLWNEPDNPNPLSYGPRDLGDGKGAWVVKRVPQVFGWARLAKPTQPLTCGIWLGDWSSEETLKPHEKVQIDHSDIVSFHCYGPADDMERRSQQLQRYDRPLLCTEYMSRGTGSTFESVMPVLKQHKVGAYNWGLVAGKTQTNYPWDSWQKPYEQEPKLWFHEIFRSDGQPYRKDEVAVIRSLTKAVEAPIKNKLSVKKASSLKPKRRQVVKPKPRVS